MKRTQIILFLIGVALVNTSAFAFFGTSGPDPNLEKIRIIRTEISASTQEIWNTIDKEIEKMLKEHQLVLNLTLEKANALTLKDIMARMESRLAWSKKFGELQEYLAHQYKEIRTRIEASDIPLPFKDEVLKHYDDKFTATAKKTMWKYFQGMGKVNETLFEIYKYIGNKRFHDKGSKSHEENLITESELNRLRNTISAQAMYRLKSIRKEFLEFESTFHFNPVEDNLFYQAAAALFVREPEKQKKLMDKFVSSYFSDGQIQAEFTLKNQIIPILNTELPQALPKASGKSLVKFAESNLSVLEKFYSSNTGADTKFCLLFADVKEFVGIDYNQILNFYFTKDATWSIEFFKAANDVLVSAKTAPVTYTLKENEIDDILKLAKDSAAVSVSKNEWFEKLLGNNKFSPRRYCFLRHALIEELLKLPSPAREDSLRLIYTREANTKPTSQMEVKK